LVEHGMIVGLGTGSAVAFLLSALARRSLGILCAATSPPTGGAARGLGLRIEDFESVGHFDITIDGADRIRKHCQPRAVLTAAGAHRRGVRHRGVRSGRTR
jgi:ribose 5-phosphate isomerase